MVKAVFYAVLVAKEVSVALMGRSGFLRKNLLLNFKNIQNGLDMVGRVLPEVVEDKEMQEVMERLGCQEMKV